MIGQGEGLQPELDGGRGEVIGLIGPVEKGVGGVGVELGIAVLTGHGCCGTWRVRRVGLRR